MANIIEQAQKSRAAYIVMGSHGHSALYDLLAGSTTTGVLKRSTCPVLIVPPAPKPAAKSAPKPAAPAPVAPPPTPV